MAPGNRRQEPARWTARLEALETRLRKLEARPAGRRMASLDPRRYWLLDALQRGLRATPASRRRGGGRVAYGGVVLVGDDKRYQWQDEHDVDQLLAVEWDQVARGFAALGHPVRLELFRALLRDSHEVQELQRLPGVGTTGQIYHHLRELQASGWVRQQQRNRYVVVPDRVVAALIVVGAVMGPGRPDSAERPQRPRAARATPPARAARPTRATRAARRPSTRSTS